MLFCMWLCAAMVQGCDRCSQPERATAIARLSELVGDGVMRDFAKAPTAWQKAAAGEELAVGDGAQTDAKSTAELSFINGAKLALKPSTTVRLLLDDKDDKGATNFDVQSGEAMLHVGHSGASLRTHVGLAMIAPDSDILLRREGDTLGFEVALGRLNFRDSDSSQVGLGVGDSVDVGIGMAVLELKRATTKEPEHAATVSIEVLSGSVQGRSAAGILLGALKKGVREIEPGAELHLGKGAEVIIKRGADRVHLHGAGDFTVGVGSALAVSRRGEMSIESMEVDVEVRVPGGVIIARKSDGGSKAEIKIGEADGQLKVLRGTLDTQLFGRDKQLTGGGELSWSHGAELIEAATEGALQSGPTYHHMETRAGESFVVHTPSAPVAVGFAFGTKCKDEAQVEVVGGHQQSRGKDSANLSFGVGSKSYAVRCIGPNGTPGKIVARGTVQVLVDSGTRKLPPRAPTSNIEADGRTYTIYYQNQLPEVAVRWANAPAQASYQLELDGKPIELSAPEHLFRSGTLKDGKHQLSFLAQGRRSRTTTVEVSFDNVAPKASLNTPDDRGFAAGEAVTVEGVALPTWKVSLEGGTIAMSGGDRFSGQVQTSTERPDIAVRLSHPRLGTHYYLRRASGTP